ncbi:hypothetical protein BCR43DRAFT_484778 [Syncephalastrum racemosum]|uniref:Uncharacterized protein n=1 Tax=Syncephalastrum racemosum TaxID=13706 RepID=A0A1X2HLF3_SYNRA|nr:hypothetical protein BCR43DRAFT_484778 [Syncephalastrum racemosum]
MFGIRRVVQCNATRRLIHTSVRAHAPNQDHMMDDMMIPGQYLKYFKSRSRSSKKPDDKLSRPAATIMALERVRTVRARTPSEADKAPSRQQMQMATRIRRGINNMYAIEPLPTALVTPTWIQIRDIKVARNLRTCSIWYEPLSAKKHERGEVFRAMSQHALRLSNLIRVHSGAHHVESIKFIPDTRTHELEKIYDALAAEEEKEGKGKGGE